MKSRELDLDEIIQLERESPPRRSRAEPETWPKAYMTEIKEAIDNEQDTVSMDGRLFTIRYFGEDSFFLRPKRGFAPCGRFSFEWLNHNE